MKSSYLGENEEYDRNRHYDCEWADLVLRKMYVIHIIEHSYTFGE